MSEILNFYDNKSLKSLRFLISSYYEVVVKNLVVEYTLG